MLSMDVRLTSWFLVRIEEHEIYKDPPFKRKRTGKKSKHISVPKRTEGKLRDYTGP